MHIAGSLRDLLSDQGHFDNPPMMALLLLDSTFLLKLKPKAVYRRRLRCSRAGTKLYSASSKRVNHSLRRGEETIVTRGFSAVLVTSLFVLSATDASSDDSIEQAWQCSSQGFEREIVLYQRNRATLEGEFACWVVYTKDGESEVLWQAKNNPDYCEPRVVALVEKLRGGGFNCLGSDRAGEPEQRDDGAQAATDDTNAVVPVALDDTDVMVPASVDDTDEAVPAAPPEKSEEKPQSKSEPERKDKRESTTAELRTLLEEHYVGSYLDAMLVAVPGGFFVQPGMDALSPGHGEYLHIAPPNNFVKTMSDGSYVLVNTTLFERGATSSYVNFGFQVHDKRFRFLGYATTQSVTDIRVLDADRDKVVLSVAPAPTNSCTPVRRTQIIAWHSDLYGRDGSEPGQTTGEAGSSDCVD